MENKVAPYLHWDTVCAACGKVTLARPVKFLVRSIRLTLTRS
jgi:hypothetical protein